MNLQQLTAFLPFLILILMIMTVMLSICYNRNHTLIALLSISGLIFSFFSLYFMMLIVPIDISNLFHIDKYSIFYVGMIIISSVFTCIFAYPWLTKYSFNKEEFYLLVLLATLGSIGLIISNHMASMFVNMELMFFPFFGLIAYSNYQKYSLEASFKYIILSSVSSVFLLLGISWIYAISSDLNFYSINRILMFLSNDNEQLVILFGAFMVLSALCFKLSIVPFHIWTADIYQGTPVSVLVFFSSVGKISVFIALLHFLYFLPIQIYNKIYFILLLMTFLSILFGNIMSLFQNNIKRLFGYLSISQLGYVFIVALAFRNNYLFSLETLGIYLFSYLLSNISFFGIVNIISSLNKKNDTDFISSYQGLFWTQPFLSVMMTISLLSLAGIPMTLGFIGKFYIFLIIIQENLWFLGGSFIIGTMLSLYCYLRVIINLYMNPLNLSEKNKDLFDSKLHYPSKIVVSFCSITLLILGLYPTSLINSVRVFLYF